MLIGFVTIFAAAVVSGTGAQAKEALPPVKSGSEAAQMKSVGKSDAKVLEDLDRRYQNAGSVEMSVEKITKLGLLQQEKKAKGKLRLSAGRLRMELEGAEKTLLVVNKKSLWAVTFPPEEFKDAAVQVIKGDAESKKARSQSIVSLLTQGGITKFFNATGLIVDAKTGESTFFLQPRKEQLDFIRAQLRVSSDGQRILGLKYWDDRDNETSFVFSDVSFGKKLDAKIFEYSPPKNADIMTL